MLKLTPSPLAPTPVYPSRSPRSRRFFPGLRGAGASVTVAISLASCAASREVEPRQAGTPVAPLVMSSESDEDQDGIPSSRDQCTTEPEDRDGFDDADGCPEPDNDRDGVLDLDDLCPDDAEDRDQLDDDDGCPDPDNDRDRIGDAHDQCPNEPETYNGTTDDDGCPDQAVVVVRTAGVMIQPKVYFAPGSAHIRDVSLPILDSIVDVLDDHTDITLVEVQGHAADPGPPASDLRLSRERAFAVFDYLVAHGVDPQRLRIVVYGVRCPVAPGDDERNRRVEFFVVRRSGSAVDEIPLCQGGVPVHR